MGLGRCCSKTFLIGFNVIFLITGAALIGVGIWVKVDRVNDVDSVIEKTASSLGLDAGATAALDKYLPYAPWALIILGGVLFLASFFGCCGATSKNRCLLWTYFFIMFVLFVAQLAVGAVALVNKGDIEGHAEQWAKKLYLCTTDDCLKACQAGSDRPLASACRDFLSDVMCGPYSNKNDCACYENKPSTESSATACGELTGKFIMRNLNIAGIFLLSTIGLELIGMLSACYMIKDHRRKTDPEHQHLKAEGNYYVS